MSNYQLIAIRYKKPGEEGVMRSEFLPHEKDRAEAFQAEREAEGCTIVSGIKNKITIEHGGGQVTPDIEILKPAVKIAISNVPNGFTRGGSSNESK